MPKNGLIKVEAGAGLIINNDTLTNDCSQCFWGGIQAVGNSSLSQYVPGNQALVTIRNGSVIKNNNKVSGKQLHTFLFPAYATPPPSQRTVP